MLWNREGTNCGDGGFGEAAAVEVAEWVVETGRIIGVTGAEEAEAGSVGLEKGDD